MNRSQVSVCFIFNGDADGLISQHLMELSGVTPSLRVTGLKREITLLERLPSLDAADIYVFDISLDANRRGLLPLLENPGIHVAWFDHHEPGILPVSERLKAHIFNGRGTCTALLVHAALPGSDPRWAAMAAFGDNVPEAGEALLRSAQAGEAETEILREAGTLLNYNAYGETAEDVLFQPLEVAKQLSSFRDPSKFIRESGLFDPLRRQFREDESQSQKLQPHAEKGTARVYLLPSVAWIRRFAGTFANRISRENPELALALLHPLRDGAYQVSIRAPRAGKTPVLTASDLAREFPTGGGRTAAAGINRLPRNDAAVFQKRFFEVYG